MWLLAAELVHRFVRAAPLRSLSSPARRALCTSTNATNTTTNNNASNSGGGGGGGGGSSTAAAADPPLLPASALLDSAFMGHVVRLAWPERHRIAGGGALLAASSGISVVFPKVMGSMMDACLLGTGGWTPPAAAAALCGLFGLQSVAIAARGRVLSIAGERVAARLRCETFGSLLRQEVAFFDTTRQGELLSRLASDTASLQKLVVHDSVGALRGALVASGCIGMMAAISPPLCALSCLSFPAAILVARRQGEKMRARQKAVQECLAAASSEAARALGSIKTLRLFGAESAAHARYAARVDAARAEAEHVGYASAISEAGVGLALQASLLTVLAVGGQVITN